MTESWRGRVFCCYSWSSERRPGLDPQVRESGNQIVSHKLCQSQPREFGIYRGQFGHTMKYLPNEEERPLRLLSLRAILENSMEGGGTRGLCAVCWCWPSGGALTTRLIESWNQVVYHANHNLSEFDIFIRQVSWKYPLQTLISVKTDEFDLVLT